MPILMRTEKSPQQTLRLLQKYLANKSLEKCEIKFRFADKSEGISLKWEMKIILITCHNRI